MKSLIFLLFICTSLTGQKIGQFLSDCIYFEVKGDKILELYIAKESGNINGTIYYETLCNDEWILVSQTDLTNINKQIIYFYTMTSCFENRIRIEVKKRFLVSYKIKII